MQHYHDLHGKLTHNCMSTIISRGLLPTIPNGKRAPFRVYQDVLIPLTGEAVELYAGTPVGTPPFDLPTTFQISQFDAEFKSCVLRRVLLTRPIDVRDFDRRIEEPCWSGLWGSTDWPIPVS
jgi:hypothetical protein